MSNHKPSAPPRPAAPPPKPAAPPRASCETCAFMRGDYCHRNPPTVWPPFNERSYWPRIVGDRWCGEHTPRSAP